MSFDTKTETSRVFLPKAWRPAVAIAVLVTLYAGTASAAVTCSVSAIGPNFGVYNPLSATPTTAAGSVTASCTLTGNTTTSVSLVSSYSTGSSGTYSSRTMLSGTNQLSYNLYYDAGYTRIRGDGTGGSQTGGATFTLTRFNRTRSTTSTIYGRMPASQDAAPGSYVDTIIVTVTY